MADPMKIRAQIVEVKALVSHIMETGQRKDNAGNTVPAHYIQSITVDVGGKRVLQGQTGPAVSRNPVFGFKVKGAKAGDKVVINWVDNKGDKRTDEATVS